MSYLNDEDRAREALSYYHNEALKYPENYKMTYGELIDYLQKKTGNSFLSGFGTAVSSLSDSDVKSAMRELANKGKGLLPTTFMGFFNALQGKAGNIHFLEAAKYTTTETIKELGTGLQEVGNVSIATLKNAGALVQYVPYLLFLGLGLYIYLRVKK